MSLKGNMKQIVYRNPSLAAGLYLFRQRLQHPQNFSNFSEDEKKLLYEIQRNGYVVIPDFIDKWQQGYDVVYAVRKRRKGSIARRVGYKCFYRLFKMLSYLKKPGARPG